MFIKVDKSRFESENGDAVLVTWKHADGASLEYQSNGKIKGFDIQSWFENQDESHHVMEADLSRPSLWSKPFAEPMSDEEFSRFVSGVVGALSAWGPRSEVRIHLSRETIPFA